MTRRLTPEEARTNMIASGLFSPEEADKLIAMPSDEALPYLLETSIKREEPPNQTPILIPEATFLRTGKPMSQFWAEIDASAAEAAKRPIHPCNLPQPYSPLPSRFDQALQKLTEGSVLAVTRESLAKEFCQAGEPWGALPWKRAQDAVVEAGCLFIAWDEEAGIVARKGSTGCCGN